MRVHVDYSGQGRQVFGMTYEYECTDCDHKWEFQQKISEDPLKNCPKCKHPTAKRLISGSLTRGFVCKGRGWYRDGYGSS